MKKGCAILLLIFLFVINCTFILADIDVHNLTLKKSYSPFQVISGKINLTLEEVEFISKFTNNLDNSSVSLEDFLDDNGADYECTPAGCSNDYIFSGGTTSKSVAVNLAQTSSVGFVLKGNNVEVTGLSLELESDFGTSSAFPLSIEFFESGLWKFDDFSDEYSPKDYGCYDKVFGIPGPLIRTSSYCETITLPETDSFELGADVDKRDSKNLKMSLYTDLFDSSWDCNFNPNTAEGCKVYADSGMVFDAGSYYVCVSPLQGQTTNYSIYSESHGGNCGFVYTSPNSLLKDYAVFAKAAMYEAAIRGGSNNLLISEEEFDDYVVYANELLNQRYNGGNCSKGCVLPLAIKGVSQSLVINNLILDYKADDEDKTPANKIYNLEIVPALLDFSGVLDLELLGIKVPRVADELILYLGSFKFLEKDIIVLPAPVVTSVSPVNPPAGVPIRFYAGVDYNGTIISYKWNFGDGNKETTTTDKVRHTYGSVGNYTITIEVNASGNLSNSASFSIEAINPKDAINISLKKFNNNLNKVIVEINKMPAWYQDKLEEIVGILSYQGELKRLEKDFKNAFEDSDYVDVATELYDLDVPKSVFVSSQESSPLISDLEDIDAAPVQMIAGGTEENLDGYKNPILRWQAENIIATISTKKISLIRESNTKEYIMMVYSVNLNSLSDEESYLIIGNSFDKLFFNGDAGARKEGDYSAIVIEENGVKDFAFYYLAGSDGSLDETGFFVSPKLSQLILEADIDTTCNFNYVCEKEFGENSSTCRSDCKPVFKMVLYLIFVFVFVFVLYTVLQVWYKSKYETILFRDKRQLYNVLMFISNARAQGKSDEEIAGLLKKQKWTNERIIYAMRKSRGERTGMYEIIPVEKIFAGLRQRKANKNFATGDMRQNTPNINKPLMRK